MTTPPAPGDDTQRATPSDEPPPLLGSWRRIYALLVLELAATTVALYALTRWLS